MPRVVVVTGAGSGLGKAIAKRFTEAGDTIYLLGRTYEKVASAAQEIGGEAIALACDVRSSDSVKAAFANIGSRHQTIDVLVNNAAAVPHGLVVEASDESIVDCFATNCIGPTFCCRSAIPMLKSGGHIINITSGAVDNNYPAMVIYAAAKAGLERFSRGLHDELQVSGIRVTALQCGQMVEDLDNWFNEPRFKAMIEQAKAAGMDPTKRPSSSFDSVSAVIKTLVDLPDDLTSDLVKLSPKIRSAI